MTNPSKLFINFLEENPDIDGDTNGAALGMDEDITEALTWQR